MRSRRSCPRGFTLIELLVVVAIIALLISILLPSLQKARKQAKAVVCLTQLHALSLGAWTYATEFGKYPPSLSNFVDSGFSSNFGGLDWLGVGDQFGPFMPGNAQDPQTGNPRGFAASPKFGKLWPYVRNEKSYLCPEDMPGPLDTNSLTGGGGNGKFSFTIFSNMGCRPPERIPPRYDTSGPPPPRGGPPPAQRLGPRALARVPIFVEESPDGINSVFSTGGTGHMEGNFNYSTDKVVSRHSPYTRRSGVLPGGSTVVSFLQGTTNFGFADGHAEGVKVNYGFTSNHIKPPPDGMGLPGIPYTAEGLLYYYGIEYEVIHIQ